MNASQELQSDVGASRVTGLGGLRFAAAVLATVGAGILAQPAPAQTPFTITMEMTAGGAVVPASVTVPDPFAIAERALGCASASCMQDVLQAVAPTLGQLPPVPSPPASPGPSQPEEPASPPPEDGPRVSPGPPAGPAVRPPKRSPAAERGSTPPGSALADLEEKLRRQLATQVRIVANGERGKIEIEYYSQPELERLLEVLGVL